MDWYVQKYGRIVEQHFINIGKDTVVTKIYLYQGRLFIETWCNNYRLLFHEII